MAQLTEVDRQYYLRLKISEDVLRRAGLDRVAEGVRFPYRPLPNGDPNPPTWTYRIRQDGDKEPKYVAEKDRHHLYHTPVSAEWAKDKNAPVIATESEKSALMLLSFAEQHRLPMIPIATGGCHGFKKKTTRLGENGGRVECSVPLPELEVVRGRDVYVWPDSNVETSIAVFSALKEFLEVVQEFGCKERRVVKFPSGLPKNINGPDDFACHYGYGPLLKLIFQTSELQTDVTVAKLAIEVADMPADCLDGELGELCTTHLLERFPRAYSWPALLAFASATIPRDPGDPRTNLYAALVGPVHTGKSQCAAWARELLGVPESNLIASYVGSGEQLAQLADAGGNARLFCPDELGHTLLKMQIERASLPFIFTRAFGEDQFSLTQSKHGTKNPELAKFNCHMSILGGIVQKKFEELFAAATTLGFYDRTFLSLCPTGFAYDYLPFPGDLKGKGFRVPKTVKIDREVWEVLADWRKKDPSLGRIAEISLRAATICACYDHRGVLKASDLTPARKLAEYQKRVRAILQPNEGTTPEGRITETLLRFMQRLEPNTGITQRDLFTKTNIHRLGVTTAVRVLSILIANGELAESSGKRRDTKLIYLPASAVKEGEST
jgi:hypothetical protein